jgi:two-component system, chemotaxis family, protein-glutamate methylesterase/glutaminase
MSADAAPGSSDPSEQPGAVARAPSNRAAAQRDIVVIGASAGGVDALGKLFAGFPPELPAAVFVVLHVMSEGASVLPKILARAGPLPAAAAVDRERIQRGRAYVAPADHHMLLLDEHVHLTRGPRENGHRPAVDPLFRSAARAFGGRVIGAVLSGALDDGTAGLRMIGEAGGRAFVQDPASAAYSSMPASALAHSPQATPVPIEDLANAICAAVEEPLPEERQSPTIALKSGAVDEPDRSDDDPRAGELTAITCPECGGSLWEHDEQGLARFKCNVGHAYSPERLDVIQSESLEGALWATVRSLQERAELSRRLARRVGDPERLERKAHDAEHHARVLRGLVVPLGEPAVPVVTRRGRS